MTSDNETIELKPINEKPVCTVSDYPENIGVLFSNPTGREVVKYVRADRQAPQVDLEGLQALREAVDSHYDFVDYGGNECIAFDREAHRQAYHLAAQGHLSPNSPEIPEGWKLVPIEPTDEMILARDLQSGWSFLQEVIDYKAMIAAAPTPPKQGDE